MGDTIILNSGQSPVRAKNILDVHLKTILENVKLLYLLEREGDWDTNQNWEDILSLGEQQRLGMVSQLKYIQPRFHAYSKNTIFKISGIEE